MKWEYPYLQWKPMDTAPKDGTDILAYNKWCDSYKVVSYAYDDLWQADSCPAQEYDLWMPLPPPPQTDTAAPACDPPAPCRMAEDGATRKDAPDAAVSPCPSCGGWGQVPIGTECFVKCHNCNGTGKESK